MNETGTQPRMLALAVLAAVAVAVGFRLGDLLNEEPRRVSTGQAETATPTETWTPTATATLPYALETVTPGGPTPTIEGFLLETPSSTPPYPRPIYTEQEAVDWSLELVPDELDTSGEIAILMPYSQLDQWRGGSSPNTAPDAPVWLVGLLTYGATMFDVVLPWFGFSGPDDPGLPTAVSGSAAHSNWEIEGLFYGWDANSGSLVGRGVLTNEASPMYSSSSMSYASLVALPGHSMQIQPATPIPSATPGPTPTNIAPMYPGDS